MSTKKKFVTQAQAESVERFFVANLQKMLDKAGLNLTAVSVGGKFNREGILLELGLLPHGSTPEDCKAFIVDRVADGHDAAPLEQGTDKFTKIAQRTGLASDRVRELAAALPKKYKCGQKIVTAKAEYIVVGYSKKKDAFVIYNKATAEVKVVAPDKFKKLAAA